MTCLTMSKQSPRSTTTPQSDEWFVLPHSKLHLVRASCSHSIAVEQGQKQKTLLKSLQTTEMRSVIHRHFATIQWIDHSTSIASSTTSHQQVVRVLRPLKSTSCEASRIAARRPHRSVTFSFDALRDGRGDRALGFWCCEMEFVAETVRFNTNTDLDDTASRTSTTNPNSLSSARMIGTSKGKHCSPTLSHLAVPVWPMSHF